MLGGKVLAGGLEIGLDRYADTEVSYISHAHSDHVNGSKKIYSSQATFDLVEKLGKGVSYQGEGRERGFSLHDAGHILGATQLAIEQDGGKWVYTGDFKLEPGLTAKGAEVVQCDVLMIESTYGLPEFLFPPREQVLREMERFVRSHEGDILLFGSYETGKAQELIKFLNDYCGLTPLVNGKIAEVCGVYEKHGHRLEFCEVGTPEAEEMLKGAFTAVLPRRLVTNEFKAMLQHAHSRKCHTAIATGWSLKYGYNVDRAFALSDHADFGGICEYAERSQAKRIVCMHGYENELAENLRNRGFDAQPFSAARQVSHQAAL